MWPLDRLRGQGDSDRSQELARVQEVYDRTRKEDARASLEALGRYKGSLADDAAFHEYHYLSGQIARSVDRERALWHARAGLTRIPDSSYLHLLAGEALERAGDVGSALHHFRAVCGHDAARFESRIDPGGGQLLNQAAHYLYLWDDRDGARVALDAMLEVHFACGLRYRYSSTDRLARFEWVGLSLPTFEELFRRRASVDCIAGEPQRGLALLDRAEAQLEAYPPEKRRDLPNLEELRMELRAWTSDPEPLVEWLESRVEPGPPRGEATLKLVLWRQRTDLTDPRAAVSAIEQVSPVEDPEYAQYMDYKAGTWPDWCNYIRRIGLLRAYRAGGDAAAAQILGSLVDENTSRRGGVLGNPSMAGHLFESGLIPEGELIKAEYRNRRMNNAGQ